MKLKKLYGLNSFCAVIYWNKMSTRNTHTHIHTPSNNEIEQKLKLNHAKIMSNNCKQNWNMKKMREKRRRRRMIENLKKHKWKCVRIFIFCKQHILTLVTYIIAAFATDTSTIQFYSHFLHRKFELNRIICLWATEFIILFVRYIQHKQSVFSFTDIYHRNAAVINCTFHDYSSVSPKMIKFIWFFSLSSPNSTQFVWHFSSFLCLSLSFCTLMCMKLKWKLKWHNWN